MRFFNKFGWILLLMIVLLLVVIGIIAIISKGRQENFNTNDVEKVQSEKIQESEQNNIVIQDKTNDDPLQAQEKNSESNQPSDSASKIKLKQLDVEIITEDKFVNKEILKPEGGVVSDKVGPNSSPTQDQGGTKAAQQVDKLEPKRRDEKSLLKQKIIKEENELSQNNVEDSIPKKQSHSSLIQLDVMRVDNAGDALVAGKAEPNVTVEMLVDQEVIGSTLSDSDGEFVVIGSLKNTTEAQTVTVRRSTDDKQSEPKLESEMSGGKKEAEMNQKVDQIEWVESEEIFIVLPTVVQNVARSNVIENEVPIIVKSSVENIQIIQTKEIVSIDQMIIDSISYSDLGEAVLVGRAKPANKILVYLDNVLAASSEVASTGGWFAELTGVEPGLYDLRLDEIDENGAVKSRIMTPFKKESKDFLMNMVSGSITVQPGNSLWRIARRIFGRGIRYIEIYEKNNDLIKNPDLIYPGQVFSIPVKN